MVLALIAVASPAASQTTTSDISGIITDARGAALNGVAVRARNADTGFARVAETDQRGTYRLAGLEGLPLNGRPFANLAGTDGSASGLLPQMQNSEFSIQKRTVCILQSEFCIP